MAHHGCHAGGPNFPIALLIRKAIPGPRWELWDNYQTDADAERAFGNYQPGRFAWITGQTRVVLPEPITMKGALGLRQCPGDIAARLPL